MRRPTTESLNSDEGPATPDGKSTTHGENRWTIGHLQGYILIQRRGPVWDVSILYARRTRVALDSDSMPPFDRVFSPALWLSTASRIGSAGRYAAV